MTVSHAAATRNDISDLVLANIDAGAGAGSIVLYISGGSTEVATLTFADPAGTVSAEVLTFDCTPALEDASPTGNASPVVIAKLFDSDSNEVIACSVGQSGADINFSGGNTFSASDTVQITSLTYTAPV